MANEISLKEMQEIELNIVAELDRICAENNINYFLGYGSCIGAVRHAGFIPWDDDIDVIMPYDDYQKLVEYFRDNNNGRYRLLCNELKTTSSIPYAKIIDSYTELVEYETISETLGVYVDIFPLYYLPDNKLLREVLFFKLKVLDYFYSCSRKKTIKGKNLLRTVAQIIIKPISILVGEAQFNTLIIRTIKNKICSDSEYVSILPPVYGKKEILSKAIFETAIGKRFDSLTLPIPIGYDSYLTQIYGDYMKLPPKEKQITHHKYYVNYKKS